MAQKSFDLRVRDCKEEVISSLNNSGLPISVLAMIVRELNETVATQYINTIQKAEAEYLEALQQESKEQE